MPTILLINGNTIIFRRIRPNLVVYKNIFILLSLIIIWLFNRSLTLYSTIHHKVSITKKEALFYFLFLAALTVFLTELVFFLMSFVTLSFVSIQSPLQITIVSLQCYFIGKYSCIFPCIFNSRVYRIKIRVYCITTVNSYLHTILRFPQYTFTNYPAFSSDQS